MLNRGKLVARDRFVFLYSQPHEVVRGASMNSCAAGEQSNWGAVRAPPSA